MPYQVTLVPNYLVAEKLNILNTYWVHLAARNLFTICSLSADEVHEENSRGSHGGGTDRRCRRMADLSADLHAVVQRCAVFRSHPCIYRLLEYGGAAADPVIRCGDASLVRVLEQDQFRRDRTGIRRGYDLHGNQVLWYFSTEKNIWWTELLTRAVSKARNTDFLMIYRHGSDCRSTDRK